jgi:hypothetical protein
MLLDAHTCPSRSGALAAYGVKYLRSGNSLISSVLVSNMPM